MSASPILIRAVLVGCIVLASVAVGFAMPLLAFALDVQGISLFMIGANAAAPALGILSITVVARNVVGRIGARGAMLAAAVAFVCLFVLLPYWRGFWPWFVLRFLIGLSTGLFWVVAEAWLNAVTPNAIRGRIFGLYGSLSAVGLAVGPLLILFTGADSALPFFAVAAIFSCTTIALLLLPAKPVEIASARSVGLVRSMRLAPAPTLAALASGFIVTTQIVLVPIFAARLGLSEGAAASMLTAVLVGAVLCQGLLGWLSDRAGRQATLLGCSLAAAMAALALCVVVDGIWVWPLLGLWGGAASVLYSVALVGIGDCFERGSLASATAALNAAYHVGNIVGPAAAGLAMDRFGPAALPATTLAVAGALTIALAGLFHVGRAATPRTSTHFLP